MSRFAFCAPTIPRSATMQKSSTPKRSLREAATSWMVEASAAFTGQAGQAIAFPYPSMTTPRTIGFSSGLLSLEYPFRPRVSPPIPSKWRAVAQEKTPGNPR